MRWLTVIAALAIAVLATLPLAQGILDPIQKPLGESTFDPAALVLREVEGVIEYQIPAGWGMRLERDVTLRPALAAGPALIYKDNGCVAMLKPGASRPEVLYRSTLKCGAAGIPSWSSDGTKYYDFFDWRHQLAEVDTGTGVIVPLTHAALKRNYKGGAHLEPIIHQSASALDETNGRILYLEQDYGKPYVARLKAVDLQTRQHSTLVPSIDTGAYINQWDFAPRSAALYLVSNRRMFKVSVSAPKDAPVNVVDETVVEFALAPDGESAIIVPPGRIYDLRTQAMTTKLPPGRCYRWSPDGRQIAFLRASEELWIYDLRLQAARRLAQIVPCADAPAWSRDRYCESPVWSKDGRMLAVGLGVRTAAQGDASAITLLLDLKSRSAVLMPFRAHGCTWTPDEVRLPVAFQPPTKP